MRKILKYIVIGIIFLIFNYKFTVWLQPYCAAPKDFIFHYILHLFLLLELIFVIWFLWNMLVAWINHDNPFMDQNKAEKSVK